MLIERDRLLSNSVCFSCLRGNSHVGLRSSLRAADCCVSWDVTGTEAATFQPACVGSRADQMKSQRGIRKVYDLRFESWKAYDKRDLSHDVSGHVKLAAQAMYARANLRRNTFKFAISCRIVSVTLSLYLHVAVTMWLTFDPLAEP